MPNWSLKNRNLLRNYVDDLLSNKLLLPSQQANHGGCVIQIRCTC
jgi:hypothetical protein